MKPSISRVNIKEIDGEFTSERTALNIVVKNEVNQKSQNNDSILVLNKIAPYDDTKVLTDKEEEKIAD